MIRYTAVEDPLCYPGTQVLRNIPDIRDQEQLDEFEQLMFDSRAQEELPNGDFDFDHYRSLHRHFFQDVYEWARQCRRIRTGKGRNWFCFPEHIESQANRLFQELADRDYLANDTDEDAFAESAAWFLSEINAIHAFREGNGRVQLVFLTMLARNAGWEINEDNLRPQEFLDAMIRSFDGDLAPLRLEIRRLLQQL